MNTYKQEFFSGVEGAPRSAVKRLTAAIERELTEATINAPDGLVVYTSKRQHTDGYQGHSVCRAHGKRPTLGR